MLHEVPADTPIDDGCDYIELAYLSSIDQIYYLPFWFAGARVFDNFYISDFAAIVGLEEFVNFLLVGSQVQAVDQDGAIFAFRSFFLLL